MARPLAPSHVHAREVLFLALFGMCMLGVTLLWFGATATRA